MAATISTTTTATQTDVNGNGNGKKIRKPYTITKSRESWTDEEHDKFIEALELFDRDWKKIQDFIGSKSVIQIRSHAQKYFLKVQKNGTSTAHVPPPRPKRKALHPYPHNHIVQPSSSSSLPHNIGSSSSSPHIPNQGIPHSLTHALPDFAQVYGFIGSVFDPDTKDHVQKLKEMDPINFETVLLLMRNLTINLSSPDFEPIDEESHYQFDRE